MEDKNQQIQELTIHNDELENYFRNTIIPQLYIDGELKLQKFTPPAMKQFNLKRTDVGKTITEIKDNFRFHTLLDNIQQVIDSDEILEKEIQTTDMRWYQMNIIPYVKIKDKKTDGVIITFVEITSRIKDLKEQERLISDHEILLDTISHDIKNPLTNLVMAIENFKTTPPNNLELFKDHLAIVERALNKINKLIGELTETRKDGPRYKPQVELLNFEHILEDAKHILSDSISESGVRIKTDIQVSEVMCARRQLRSIIFNLVNNAIKFRSPDRSPEVLISTSKSDEHVMLSVKDNGIGIDPSKFEAIFSKHFRIENSIEGSGIGLYLVREIVKGCGGKIEVDSEPGKGTEFRIYFKNPSE